MPRQEDKLDIYDQSVEIYVTVLQVPNELLHSLGQN